MNLLQRKKGGEKHAPRYADIKVFIHPDKTRKQQKKVVSLP